MSLGTMLSGADSVVKVSEGEVVVSASAFAAASGVPGVQAKASIAAIKERLPVLSPEQDVDLLRAAGFADIELFYGAFTFKGWVARRP